MIVVTLVFGVVIGLVAHSRIVSDEHVRVAVLSAENLRGTMKWLLIGAPFYLFLIFAPDKYFLDDDDIEN